MYVYIHYVQQFLNEVLIKTSFQPYPPYKKNINNHFARASTSASTPVFFPAIEQCKSKRVWENVGETN